MCNSGYIFSNDNTACISSPSISNCDTYSYISCANCKSGYYMNQNYYLIQFYSTAAGIYSVLARLSTNANLQWSPQIQCALLSTVANCITYAANNNTCTACATGYFLTANTCQVNPVGVIPFCNTYSSYTVCTQCQQGYFLQSANTCVAVTTITNCQTYDGSQTSSVCFQCISGYYVNNNACVLRVNSANIANCATLTNNADTCSICNTSFILTNDGRLCLTSIANCSSYGTSSYQSGALTCILCNSGYYLGSGTTANTCIQGTIVQCAVYSVNSNTCVTCVNGYYLTNNSCVAHVQITNCATYSQSAANTCVYCGLGYYSFNYTTICNSVTVIPNCSSYSLIGTTCTACNSGYYVNSLGACTINPAVTNCI